MNRFSLRIFFFLWILLTGVSSGAQVVYYGLTENPVLFPEKQVSGQRNLISDSRVVVIPSDSQTLCINRPEIGTFDTLILDQASVNPGIDVKITENCIVFIAEQNAELGDYEYTFDYSSFSGNSLKYRVALSVVEPRGLPFFDDFAYNDKYPDQRRWVDKNVFINNTMGDNPPSVGVATFDGLNSNGSPYGGGFGRADYLTSTFFDLSGVQHSEPVFLSYYLQPKGKTYNHQLRDSIELEFKNKSGQWERIVAYKGIDPSFPSSYVPPFEYYSVQVDPKYFYRGFQFRFVNYNYRLGVYSTWHLDYVKLIANQLPGLNQQDIAFTDPPNRILRTYSAIPYRQLSGFEDKELADTTKIRLYNHFLEVAEDLGDPRLEIQEITTGTEIYNGQLVNTVPQLNPPAGFNAFDNPFDPQSIAASVASVPAGQLPLIFRTKYHFDQDQEVSFLEENNTVTSEAEVGYVLAYDDGSAELNIAAEANNSVKSQIAVKFRLNTGDTLRAVQFHFPRLYDDVSHQLFNLKIWVGSLKEEPDYYYQLQRPVYADTYYDTLQGFTTYPLVNDLTQEPLPLYIPPGDFYIGWQQFSVSSTGQFIPVGFDRNYQGGEALTYYKSTGDWKPMTELTASPLLKGIPMIRAKFQDAWKTSSTTQSKATGFYVFPNPVSSVLNIGASEEMSDNATYHIIDITGKVVMAGDVIKPIDTGGLSEGIYFLLVRNKEGKNLGNARFVKVR
ncbi:MAG TPA: T9SS type A sorting domain-containing protein [Saprospiraceae bacterium]|jgi:hypothetical protein|nr:T9SS type A sorting domain-containing protein [Saprospiraceae bacterium]MBX7178521.1 T9SS type A sorting domain-containing protein [Saprospiraceae bacterium]MCB0590280.1 T9SS type A sorting domain-containing protein [Saprospiraceae bacterium]MCO5282046.1 T9SS type A sorting domain-containing protein [Saprospiraceae bacterium]MCO6471022.1 T9SS type A sorting domain-containing protein [Saprospiraceae bacterium]